MKINDIKLRMILKDNKKCNNLFDIALQIEYELNYILDFDYSKVNLLNLHSILEKTFNYELSSNLLNMDHFSKSYKELNNLMDLLENVIKIYGIYIKDQDLKQKIKDLGLNTNKDLSKFFLY